MIGQHLVGDEGKTVVEGHRWGPSFDVGDGWKRLLLVTGPVSWPSERTSDEAAGRGQN